jgi:hypothetical protein
MHFVAGRKLNQFSTDLVKCSRFYSLVGFNRNRRSYHNRRGLFKVVSDAQDKQCGQQ